MSEKKMIYLASPHTHTLASVRNDRYLAALECTSWLIENGFWVFSPIVHSHNLEISKERIDFEKWREFDFEIIRRMDEVWVLMMNGTETSKGVKEEIKFAKENDKKTMAIMKILDPLAMTTNMTTKYAIYPYRTYPDKEE
jgi:nucleoside 2-deoxyribosyltransferase